MIFLFDVIIAFKNNCNKEVHENDIDEESKAVKKDKGS